MGSLAEALHKKELRIAAVQLLRLTAVERAVVQAVVGHEGAVKELIKASAAGEAFMRRMRRVGRFIQLRQLTTAGMVHDFDWFNTHASGVGTGSKVGWTLVAVLSSMPALQ